MRNNGLVGPVEMGVFVHNLRVDMAANTHYLSQVDTAFGRISQPKSTNLDGAIARAKRALRSERGEVARVFDSFGTVVARVTREGREFSVYRSVAA